MLRSTYRAKSLRILRKAFEPQYTYAGHGDIQERRDRIPRAVIAPCLGEGKFEHAASPSFFSIAE